MSSVCIEHPDITSAAYTGYASYQNPENRDTPEHRKAYIEERYLDLLRWMRIEYPEILDEFIECSKDTCMLS